MSGSNYDKVVKNVPVNQLSRREIDKDPRSFRNTTEYWWVDYLSKLRKHRMMHPFSQQWVGAGSFDGAPIVKDEGFYREWIITDYADTAVGKMTGLIDGVVRFDPLGFFGSIRVAFGGSALQDAKKPQDGKNFHDYPATTLDDKAFTRLGDMLKGRKATLVVNVATY